MHLYCKINYFVFPREKKKTHTVSDVRNKHTPGNGDYCKAHKKAENATFFYCSLNMFFNFSYKKKRKKKSLKYKFLLIHCANLKVNIYRNLYK